MEEGVNQQKQSTPQPQATQDQVSNVVEPQASSGGKKKIVVLFIIAIIIAALAGAGWFVFSGPSVEEIPPIDNELSTPETLVTPTVTPAPSPIPLVRSEIKIQILNGSGVPGQASELGADLEDLGYEGIELDNADEQGIETTVLVFSKSVSSLAVDEIKELLELGYEEVKVKPGNVGGFDIKITTGFKKGYTPTPTGEEKESTPTPTDIEDEEEITPSPTGSQ